MARISQNCELVFSPCLCPPLKTVLKPPPNPLPKHILGDVNGATGGAQMRSRRFSRPILCSQNHVLDECL